LTQNQVDRWLTWGVVFSIVWLAGLGSIFALVAGIKTKRAIESSDGELAGRGRVMWCLIVGGLGVAVWVPIILISVINQL
jgi:hypothetical protein